MAEDERMCESLVGCGGTRPPAGDAGVHQGPCAECPSTGDGGRPAIRAEFRGPRELTAAARAELLRLGERRSTVSAELSSRLLHATLPARDVEPLRQGRTGGGGLGWAPGCGNCGIAPAIPSSAMAIPTPICAPIPAADPAAADAMLGHGPCPAPIIACPAA